jgi:hypothetical protein
VILYTAGPYRAPSPWGVHLNIETAKIHARELWLKGHAVICPHANSAFMDGEAGTTDRVFLEGDLALLGRCDGIVMLPGWESSKGATAELGHARVCGLAVYMSPSEVPHVS